MAPTAATPIARGVLLDTDARWISSPPPSTAARPQSAATPTRRGRRDVQTTAWRAAGGSGPGRGTPRSRTLPTATRAARPSAPAARTASPRGVEGRTAAAAATNQDRRDAEYNDIEAPYDEAAYAQLVAGGVDATLARHVAHLFVRDPLVIRGRVDVDDATQTDHFENLQSTNWQTVKPPAKPPSHIGWRTEFEAWRCR